LRVGCLRLNRVFQEIEPDLEAVSRVLERIDTDVARDGEENRSEAHLEPVGTRQKEHNRCRQQNEKGR